MERVTDAHQKALSINMDINQYGTIAEIGAGQETARWFFRVGGAAGTVAKAISAYDMQVSDAIYGSSSRYVSRERLEQMLSVEYDLVVERLDSMRGEAATFFAFANTVAARSFSRATDGQGWLGVRFQAHPRAEPSQIDLHVTLHGTQHLEDQETLGLIGINLIYAVLNHWQDPSILLDSLMDGVYPEFVEIDMIDFVGPAFESVDNRLMALHLVQRGLSPAAMFNPEGELVHVADALYNKPVIVERSRFRPPTHLTMNMLECAQQQFCDEQNVAHEDVVVLSEMTLNNLSDDGDIDPEDFLHRAEILGALGKNVLISNMAEYYELAGYLYRNTKKPIGLVLGVPTLVEVFNESFYDDLPGGILEAFGRLFKNDLRLYVCPALEQGSAKVIDLDAFTPAEKLRHLFAHLRDNDLLQELVGIDRELLSIYSHEVLALMQAGDPAWEKHVPASIVSMIRDQKLFGFDASRQN